MERNMTRSEFLNEDGHGKRDEDLVEDDMENMRQLHRDFIAVLDKAEDAADTQEAYDEAINIEQCFRDMLHKRVSRLEEESGISPFMPKSERLTKWEKSR